VQLLPREPGISFAGGALSALNLKGRINIAAMMENA
jgi:hypothetical protein